MKSRTKKDKSSSIYTIIYRKEYQAEAYADLSKAAASLHIHVNTLRYRLKTGYYCDDNHIIIITTYYPSIRGNKPGYVFKPKE